MENEKEKLSFDSWFSQPDMKITLKQLSEMVLKNSCLQKFMSSEKVSVAKLYSCIYSYFSRYFFQGWSNEYQEFLRT